MSEENNSIINDANYHTYTTNIILYCYTSLKGEEEPCKIEIPQYLIVKDDKSETVTQEIKDRFELNATNFWKNILPDDISLFEIDFSKVTITKNDYDLVFHIKTDKKSETI